MRRDKAAIFSGCNSHPATFAPAGSNRSGEGGNELAEASGVEGRLRRLGEQAGRNISERHPGLETTCCGSRPGPFSGKAVVAAFGERNDPACGPTGVKATACLHKEIARNAGDPKRRRVSQPEAREGQAGCLGESERFIVPLKPGNAGGGKGP